MALDSELKSTVEKITSVSEGKLDQVAALFNMQEDRLEALSLSYRGSSFSRSSASSTLIGSLSRRCPTC